MKNIAYTVAIGLSCFLRITAQGAQDKSESEFGPIPKTPLNSVQCVQSFQSAESEKAALRATSLEASRELKKRRSAELRDIVLRNYKKELEEMFDSGYLTQWNFEDIHFVEAHLGIMPGGRPLNLILAFEILGLEHVQKIGSIKYFQNVEDGAPSGIQLELSSGLRNRWKFWDRVLRPETITFPRVGNFSTLLRTPSLFGLEVEYYRIPLTSNDMIRAIPADFVNGRQRRDWLLYYHPLTGSTIVSNLGNDG